MTAPSQPSLLSDLKTGLEIGKWPLAVSAVTVVTADILYFVNANLFKGDARALPTEGGDAPLSFFLISGALFCLHILALFLGYCWLLTRWLSTEFGTSEQQPSKSHFRYVAIQQGLAALWGLATFFLIGLVTSYLTLNLIFIPLIKTFFLKSDSPAYLGILIAIPALLAVAFTIHFLGVYVYVRLSTGVGIAARTVTRIKFREAFARCAEIAPQGSVSRTAARITGYLFLYIPAILSLEIGLAWLLWPEAVIIGFDGGFSITIDTDLTPFTLNLLVVILNAIVITCLGAFVAATLVRHIRRFDPKAILANR
ncbi:hypothetical protein AB3X55_04655 [Alphaproteobacteria bacterium LSUCC0719]